jgi:Ca2+-binding EF-hand superfamily protein
MRGGAAPAPAQSTRGGYKGLAQPGSRPPNGSMPVSPSSRGQTSPSSSQAGGIGMRAAAPRSMVAQPKATSPPADSKSPRMMSPPEPPSSVPASASASGVRPAIKISGCTGKYSLINDTYELMQMNHQDRPCWCARAAAPVYLFHTGKARWVISKRINDGSRCYAFVTDNGSPDPTGCPGPWLCCGDDGNWNPDMNITCVPAEASNDPFVRLRMQVEDDLSHFGLTDANSLKQLWRKLDKNGNGYVSLAEIDALVVEMTKIGMWPEWVNNKDSMQRAYQKTIKLDGNGNDWVEKEEFHELLLNLFWFGHIHQVFEEIDTTHDDRIDFNEIMAGITKLGLNLSEAQAHVEFENMDADHSGMVLFAEFCAYVRRRVQPDHNPAFDTDIVSGDKAGETLRKKHGDKATHNNYVNKKSLEDFDNLEKKIKELINDQEQLKKLWSRLDFNGNGVVSLAEVDKLIVQQYPLLNHKPALMRAFQATLREGDNDDWVQKHEFKMLLGNLFYFNKLFWLFDQVDEDKDRRMTYNEFKWCMSVAGDKMSDAKCQAEFKKVDVNGGGIILFDEFCRYFTDKACPESMTHFIETL